MDWILIDMALLGFAAGMLTDLILAIRRYRKAKRDALSGR